MHIDAARQALANYRVLRPGGYIFVCGSKRTLHLIASSEPIEGAHNPIRW
jgi:hypothetical protein